MGRLDGRVAIVTGAGQGIGRGIARRSPEGAAVVVAERNPETGAAVAAEIMTSWAVRAIFVETDVLEADQIDAMVARAVDEFGTVHILVNNAYVAGGFARFEHKPDGDLELAFHGGPEHTWRAMRAVFPHMKTQQWGRIINLVSLNGINAHKYSADYNAAKEAIRAITRTGRGRVGTPQHPLQLHRAGGGVARVRGVRSRRSGEREGDAAAESAPAHGRPRARHRRRRAVLRQRRLRLRHGQHDLRERGHAGERRAVGPADAGLTEAVT